MPTGVEPACSLGLLIPEPEILTKSVAIGVTLVTLRLNGKPSISLYIG